jgi:hypothetical protein
MKARPPPAAELLLKLDDGAIDYMRLLKLLYIAERRALERWAWAP